MPQDTEKDLEAASTVLPETQVAKKDDTEELSLLNAEIRLISQLRHEAEQVKDCYTQFAFKAWTFVSAMVGIFLGAVKYVPEAAIASPLIIVVLLAVVRIGQHKYTTANRHFGFELYMNRRRRFRDSVEDGGWRNYMRRIGWEEAQYAWRVVQASVYDEIYGMTPFNKLPIAPIRPKNEYLGSPLVTLKTTGNAIYYAGGYLAKTSLVLHGFAYFATIPLGVAAFAFYYGDYQYYFELSILSSVLFFGSLVFITLRYNRTTGKRQALESGLMSINSSAIVWNAVVIAHYRALHALSKRELVTTGDMALLDYSKAPILQNYQHYSEELSGQAAQLVQCIQNRPDSGIYDWCKSIASAEEASGNPSSSA